MKTLILKTTLILLPLGLTLPVLAQTSGDQTSSSAESADMSGSSSAPSGAASDQSMVSHADRAFANKLAEGSTNEIALSQLADSHAASGDVKSFAQMMIQDHTKLNAQFSDLCSRKGVDIQAAVDRGQKKGVSSLESKNGADFDKAYLHQMVKSHKATVQLLKKEAADTKDSDFQQFANMALPIVEMHLQKAEQLQQSMQ